MGAQGACSMHDELAADKRRYTQMTLHNNQKPPSAIHRSPFAVRRSPWHVGV